MSRGPGTTLNTRSIPNLGLELGWLLHNQWDKECTFASNREETVFLLLRGEVFSDEGFGNDGCTKKAAAQLLSQLSPENLEVISNLNGWFSGVLVDTRVNNAILFNDRYGLGRMYYHRSSHGFVFASEAKAVLKVVPALRQFDIRSLGEFWSCGCVLQDRTLFRDVFILPAASAWIVRPNGIVEKQRYFEPSSWEKQSRLSPQSYYNSLRDVFPKVLKRYVKPEGDMGMSLTGGLDGRLIMAWSKTEPGQMPCYSFGSSFRETEDVCIAREVAFICQQPYSELKVDGEFLSDFPRLAQQAVSTSDGAMDVSGAAELYVNRLARQVRPVRLTGNYGSEILRGNIALRPKSVMTNVLSPDLAKSVEQARATYAEESQCDPRSFIAFKQVPWHHFGRASLEKSELAVRSPYLDNDLVKLSFQAPEAARTDFDLSLKLVADGNSKLAEIPTDRGLQYGVSNLLNQLGRSRKEFLAKAEYAYDYGMPNWLAQVDRLLSPLKLERVFLGRQKFYHFRTWYRRELASFVRELLLDRRTLARPWLNRRCLEDTVRSHIEGHANHTLLIHNLLSLELVQRGLLEQDG